MDSDLYIIFVEEIRFGVISSFFHFELNIETVRLSGLVFVKRRALIFLSYYEFKMICPLGNTMNSNFDKMVGLVMNSNQNDSMNSKFPKRFFRRVL